MVTVDKLNDEKIETCECLERDCPIGWIEFPIDVWERRPPSPHLELLREARTLLMESSKCWPSQHNSLINKLTAAIENEESKQ